MGSSENNPYALRFISGKYQGGEFPLHTDREIVIGRSSDLDMVLVEDMVSRKHAKITTENDQIQIQDLGSTNGTFVNGEKIKKVRIKEGDRILIGTSIIKVVALDPNSASAQMSEAEARSRLDQNAQKRQAAPSKPMSGTIDEIPLPDLLQLLSTGKKSGVLAVTSEQVGKIYLRKGQIYYASIDDSFDISPRKAAFRILTWQSGTFELELPDDRAVLGEIQESTEALLMEGMRQIDEFMRIEPELPPRQAVYSMVHPLSSPLRDLKPDELEMFQLVLNVGQLQAVLDKASQPDFDAAAMLLSLAQRNYIEIAQD